MTDRANPNSQRHDLDLSELINLKPANLQEMVDVFETLFDLIEKGSVQAEAFGEIELPVISKKDTTALLKGYRSKPSIASHYLVQKIFPLLPEDVQTAFTISTAISAENLVINLEEMLDKDYLGTIDDKAVPSTIFALYLLNPAQAYDQVCVTVRRITYSRRTILGGLAGILGRKTVDQTTAETDIKILNKALGELREISGNLEEFYARKYQKKSYTDILAEDDSGSALARDDALKIKKGIKRDQEAFPNIDSFKDLPTTQDYRILEPAFKFLVKKYQESNDMKDIYLGCFMDAFLTIRDFMGVAMVDKLIANLKPTNPALGNRLEEKLIQSLHKLFAEIPKLAWKYFKSWAHFDIKSGEMTQKIVEQISIHGPLQNEANFIQAFFEDTDSDATSATLERMPKKVKDALDKAVGNFDFLKDDIQFSKKLLIAIKSDSFSEKITAQILSHPRLEEKTAEFIAKTSKLLILSEKSTAEVNQFIKELKLKIAAESKKRTDRIEAEKQRTSESIAAATAAKKAREEAAAQAKAAKNSSSHKPAERPPHAADFVQIAREKIKANALPPDIEDRIPALGGVRSIQKELLEEIVLDPLLQEVAFDGKDEIIRVLEANSPLRLLGAEAVKITKRTGGGFDISLIVKIDHDATR